MNYFHQDCKRFSQNRQALLHTSSNPPLSRRHVKMFSEEYKIIKIMNFPHLSPLPPLMSKYSSTHPVLEHPQSVFSFSYERPSFTSIQNNQVKFVFYKLHVSRHAPSMLLFDNEPSIRCYSPRLWKSSQIAHEQTNKRALNSIWHVSELFLTADCYLSISF